MSVDCMGTGASNVQGYSAGNVASTVTMQRPAGILHSTAAGQVTVITALVSLQVLDLLANILQGQQQQQKAVLISMA